MEVSARVCVRQQESSSVSQVTVSRVSLHQDQTFHHYLGTVYTVEAIVPISKTLQSRAANDCLNTFVFSAAHILSGELFLHMHT